ncbi:uncharacterized protein EV420DRAFT_1649724 [Desarmillaria tabescens]|uniref:Cytochrome P450 n=1 Tax=Armillaria tabescens TaxID=1929756 RepID=A0AA39JI83_ARMTA|nr:uncharacterized protein EV420DRAFT_1649724 [Desarmillaria tabescens]KAK0442256.1 hypothetical protein EV420DRAFT_1649724 [Desarmillaria tabescens]
MVALTLVIASLLVSTLLYRWFRRPSVKYVKGPPSASFWLGHERVLRNQDNAGDLETNWRREYGTLSCWGLLWDVLVVCDPKAFEHIFHKSRPYPKSKDTTFILNLFIGQGLATITSHSDEPQTARITGENEQGYAKRKTPSPAEGEIWAEVSDKAASYVLDSRDN